MSRVQWSTLICDVDPEGRSTGRISLHRVRKFSVIAFAWIGFAILCTAGFLEIVTRVDVPTDVLLMITGASVVPLTGGQVSDAIFGKKLSKDIQAGRAPGRRASDAASTGPQDAPGNGG